jgi:hypothetical protein
MAEATTRFEQRVTTAALAAAPVVAILGVGAMLLAPHVFAESDTASGSGLWLGALLGLGAFAVVVAVPQLLFGLALRSGTRRKLTATAIGAPLWALYVGLLPLLGALENGWEGLAPLAVATAALAGGLDCFVTVAALRGLRRLRSRHPSPGAPTPAG